MGRLAHFPQALLLRSDLSGAMAKLKSQEPFHLAFIDGSHEYDPAMRDVRLAVELLAPGGVIIGHDFAPWYLDVLEAVFHSAVLLGISEVSLGPDVTWWFTVP